MKVGYSVVDRTLHREDDELKTNLTSEFSQSPVEGGILFSVAILGALGNSFVMIVTLTCPKFRQMSSSFLFHHCLLDAIKSIFCLPFGYSLLMKDEIPHCDVLGAAYILLMTVSAYNLLALLLNEEYQCSYMSKNNGQKNGDSCCIAFGIVIIWFTTVLLHLGVAFLPGSSEFSKDIGNCVYRYGITKNYVIHALWVLLVTGAIIVAVFSFIHFYRKLQSTAKSRKWTYLHKSLSSSNQHNASSTTEEIHYEFDDSVSQTTMLQTHHYMRRLIILLLMLVSFVVCWYPLFFLTLLDVHYQQPPSLYRILMIVAWTHPLTTPVFCAFIYHDQGRGNYKECYTNAIPMTTSRSSQASGELNHLSDSTANLTFLNQNFHWDPQNHVIDSPRRQPSQFMEYPHLQCDTVTNYNADEGACHTLIM